MNEWKREKQRERKRKKGDRGKGLRGERSGGGIGEQRKETSSLLVSGKPIPLKGN